MHRPTCTCRRLSDARVRDYCSASQRLHKNVILYSITHNFKFVKHLPKIFFKKSFPENSRKKYNVSVKELADALRKRAYDPPRSDQSGKKAAGHPHARQSAFKHHFGRHKHGAFRPRTPYVQHQERPRKTGKHSRSGRIRHHARSGRIRHHARRIHHRFPSRQGA